MENAFIANVFVTLGFFLPGFGAKLIWDYLRDRNEEKSELKTTILSLAWNIPSIFLGWVLASLWRHHWKFHSLRKFGFLNLQQFMSFIQTLVHFTVYMVFSFSVDICIGGLSAWGLRWLLTKRSQSVRVRNNLPVFTEGVAWERFLGADDNVTLKIYPIGREDDAIGGYVESIYQPGDIHRGVTLLETEIIKSIVRNLSGPTRTFIEFDTQLVFELYTAVRMREIADATAEVNNEAPTRDQRGADIVDDSNPKG